MLRATSRHGKVHGLQWISRDEAAARFPDPAADCFPLPGLRRRAEALAYCLKDAVAAGDLPQWAALQWIRRTCDEVEGDEVGLAHIRRACILEQHHG